MKRQTILIYKGRFIVDGIKIKQKDSIHIKKNKLNLYQKIIDYVFRPMRLGRLTMRLPDGRFLIYGNGKDGVEAEITIRNNNFFKKCVFFGDVGFGESYVDGDWDTEDITKVIEWMIINVEHHPTLMSDKKKRAPVNWLKVINNLISLVRKNSLNGSRKNIYEHYDLGNDFFKLFLDPSMTYSSAYFKNEQMSLEQAQYQKYEQFCQKIRLRHTDHLLEIGSGWGGFAMYAVRNFGCRVTTITVSQEQHDFVEKRIKEEGLVDKINVKLTDYRKIKGVYDKIVSIEMLEAVGHEYYEEYFRQCHNLLKKDGIMALQVILSPDNRYESFRKNVDWIEKHIFPGSLLPSTAVLLKNVNKSGDLGLFDFEDITPHYVKTLDLWCRNFNQQLASIKAMRFDESFIRQWNYYWCYCKAAFQTRNISVAQMVFSRPNNLTLS